MKTTKKALEQSIFWQEYVLRNSKDKAQKQRAIVAIDKLKKELEQYK
jgi:hypothetical protein